ncbi:MAG: hypothetical protein AAF791_11865 [Bacteroidota bacterium]
MFPLHLRQLGQYDAAFEAEVSPDGRFRVEGGSYVTRGVREGRLSLADLARLGALAEAVHREPEADIPDGADGFGSTLEIGGRTVRWWGPPPTEAHRALMGALAALGT